MFRRDRSYERVIAVLPMFYDPLVWVLGLGRVKALRQATLGAAQISAGDAVLDAGCGTGAVAVEARVATGPTSRVVGMDSSSAMLERARRRSDRAHAAIELIEGPATAFPFPDACFDVVVFSLVMHYLTAEAKTRAIGEARRVLREGGRVVLVDFGRSDSRLTRLNQHLMLHGGVASRAPDLGALLLAGDLVEVSSQPSPLAALHVVRGTRRDY